MAREQKHMSFLQLGLFLFTKYNLENIHDNLKEITRVGKFIYEKKNGW